MTGDADPLPSGAYRTQAPGPFSPVNPGPPLTSLGAAFAGIPTSTGTWKLVVGDCAGGDTGSVAAAGLLLVPPLSLFSDGFESGGTCEWDSTAGSSDICGPI